MPGSRTSRTAVVSRSPSAARTGGARARLAAAASESIVRKRRRVCMICIGILPLPGHLRLQLAFELVQEAPVRALGDYLLWARLDEARLVQPQGIVPDRVLGIVL